ncbi:LytR/AlgR family response regulator transcription factor [Spirosoma spitsbergense]|uniref:LytR/AlgR family response regulator transcription factor n=1 Tax=Spirosoma spitsbergense TaxID=431554 RepID=UPI000367A466|nr:LytTR family DNA-binding domain-containing protein [Spirosoma spitsbergense]
MKKIAYPDKLARVVGIPVWSFLFRLIGDPSPLGDLLQNSLFYLDVVVVIGVNILLWESNRWLIQQMDTRYSWAMQPLHRFYVQAGVAFIWTVGVIALFSLGYNNLILQRPAPFNLSITISNDIPIGLLFILLLHMGYTMYWMVRYHRHTVAGLQQKIARLKSASPIIFSGGNQPGARTLLVNHGKAQVPITTDQVAFIFIANEVSIVKTADSKSFVLDLTMEQVAERLSSADFFRLNRQFLVNRQAIQRVENDGVGRIVLYLKPSHAEEVVVSRRRVAEFRQWMQT